MDAETRDGERAQANKRQDEGGGGEEVQKAGEGERKERGANNDLKAG